VAVLAATAVAIVIVVGGIDLPGGDGDEPAKDESRADPRDEGEEEKPPRKEPPSNPDDLRGSSELSLTRPRNFGRALRLLAREADEVEGRLDYMRIAPGRIDTRIARRGLFVTLQVRANLKITFRVRSQFPVPDALLERTFSPRGIDADEPARLLRAIDERRPGSTAAADLDYMVTSADPIQGGRSWSVFMEGGPAPRMFRATARPSGLEHPSSP
jgi:hypothetical protein